MLRLESISCAYGAVQVLDDVSFEVGPGEIVGLLGRNGAGKTTTMKAIMGLVPARAGTITLEGIELTALKAHQVPPLGVAYVPQGRGLFSGLSVEENLRMGMLVRDSGPEVLDEVLQLFPVLTERLRQRAGTLSGGEQQMLATARALCLGPKVLLLDEPSEGLMPMLVDRLLETIKGLTGRGISILIVEQKVEAALRVADRIVFMENGTIRGESTPTALAVTSASIGEPRNRPDPEGNRKIAGPSGGFARRSVPDGIDQHAGGRYPAPDRCDDRRWRAAVRRPYQALDIDECQTGKDHRIV